MFILTIQPTTMPLYYLRIYLSFVFYYISIASVSSVIQIRSMPTLLLSVRTYYYYYW